MPAHEFILTCCLQVAPAAAALWLGLTAGFRHGRAAERDAAVQAGAARWFANPATGEARFEYRRGCDD